ncbi:hypothetical protein [Loktanella sp. M215]|uniref:hypothetical protein n=1 Tax=Loktanella sp. M215 TaxID=2675431 RepID=UPI001F46F38D|nr:hypothetical protein [Loktanella sp. M215]MCF7698930.1 hypothetical protein [Loktanella sp. M215]
MASEKAVHGVSALWRNHVSWRDGTVFLHRLEQLSTATEDRKTEGTYHERVNIGIVVSRNWLDLVSLLDGQNLLTSNTRAGHNRLVDLARLIDALICCEASVQLQTDGASCDTSYSGQPSSRAIPTPS